MLLNPMDDRSGALGVLPRGGGERGEEFADAIEEAAIPPLDQKFQLIPLGEGRVLDETSQVRMIDVVSHHGLERGFRARRLSRPGLRQHSKRSLFAPSSQLLGDTSNWAEMSVKCPPGGWEACAFSCRWCSWHLLRRLPESRRVGLFPKFL